jgi:hypothetical protein
MELLNGIGLPGKERTHEDQGRIEIFIVLFDKMFVVFCGFLPIQRVEIHPRITGPRWFEEETQCILNTEPF